MKITFVCAHNKCRSPLAEVIAKEYIKINNLDNITIFSHGEYFGLEEGTPPCEYSIKEASSYNLDIKEYKSSKLTKQLINEIDIIFIMDKANYNNVCFMANDEDINTLGVHPLLNRRL